ncbi:MAG: [NiFe]-hydrogenase assembly chaperone HybE [Candidatus Thiodiazotropha sp.]|jgi:[NiFe] hydrogenase assembly HybE family chaperone
MICPEYLTQGLEQVFSRIERERMQGLPILNKALQVRAVGFREWQGHCLGVLITPWFMNLMLLPCEGDDWQNLRIGDKQLHQLPSGPYEFILGEETGVGRYQMCSLFSPVFEFADQVTAEATAEAAMAALMEAENRDTISTHEREIERRWRGDEEGEGEESEATAEALESEESMTIGERLEQPLSRRDLLRGKLAREPQA